MSRHPVARHARTRSPSAVRRRAPAIGLLVALACVPTLVAVVAGSRWLDEPAVPRRPYVAAAPEGPVVVGPGDTDAPDDLPVARVPGTAWPQQRWRRAGGEPGRTESAGGSGGGHPESCDQGGTGGSRPGTIGPSPTGPSPAGPSPTGPSPTPSGPAPGPTDSTPSPSPPSAGPSGSPGEPESGSAGLLSALLAAVGRIVGHL